MKKIISIIGGGSSALILACFLDSSKYEITLFERNNTIGRKFLVAGSGGFNLTHSETPSEMVKKYTPYAFMAHAFSDFTNIDLKNWLNKIGIETYIGSSKRVFPIKGIKPIQVLNAISEKIKQNKVTIKTKHNWIGWDEDSLQFKNEGEIINVKSDITVFAMGGGSWKVTGSDGAWISHFEKHNIHTKILQASNCACQIAWTDVFLKLNEGKSIKNITISCNGIVKKGEIVITQFGMEGGAIYALSSAIRNQIKEQNYAEITIDLKPSYNLAEIFKILKNSHKQTINKCLKDDFNFSNRMIELLKNELTKEDYINPEILAQKIKNLPLKILSLAALDEAISTVGGVGLDAITKNYELKNKPNTYCIGEMLDWDAPTGGYLLQACFSMGVKLALYLNQK
ncbi:MAG: TIGR03862 family flavoprotein [Bacteroidetes bacterium]|nr:TIGR03862 family flavoprotein [Bacteroidota bacterium]